MACLSLQRPDSDVQTVRHGACDVRMLKNLDRAVAVPANGEGVVLIALPYTGVMVTGMLVAMAAVAFGRGPSESRLWCVILTAAGIYPLLLSILVGCGGDHPGWPLQVSCVCGGLALATVLSPMMGRQRRLRSVSRMNRVA